ncbi:rod shape-determining protein MreC [Sungkyunkwania multivorans]|uniref:Cell shape-determining protein MreC n=1 Tax=Sungkyunkwania multivorans TaxID=1173618 RepID=A0ABW3D1N6_9FLAO
MQQIINFFIRNKNFLLFLLLLVFSLSLTIQSHSYHRSKFIKSANWLSGGVYESVNNIDSYFNLKGENERLIQENKRLRQLLFNQEDSLASGSFIDSTSFKDKYIFRAAKVIKNSYNKPNNYLTINKGSKDGIREDMGVITSEGIIGVVDRVSGNYARVISVLNELSTINAKHKISGEIGSLIWNAEDHRLVQLIDIPKLANVKKGDTIITGGESTIFPQGIMIGVIENFSLDVAQSYYNLDISLFNSMTHVGYVYVIENIDASEIRTLQSGTNE